MNGHNPNKVYVPVRVEFDDEGRMFPRALEWEDGQVYEIDRVLDVRPSFAAKAGGMGDRYTVRTGGRDTYLFFEHNGSLRDPSPGRWFVERRKG